MLFRSPASGIGSFGASHVVLKPGAWSSQRHWHDDEDEMLVMLSGEAVLVEDEGRMVGTYRLLRSSVAAAHGGFYSAQEYGLAAIERHQKPNRHQ